MHGAEIGCDDIRVVAHLLRAAVTDLAAVIEHDDMVGQAHHHADIVLDQFRIGDYGVGACETMASGRIVLTALTDEVRAEVEAAGGMPIPIPEVTVDNLEAVIRDIDNRREHYRELAAHGPEFVRRLHDGGFSRDVLLREFLEA